MEENGKKIVAWFLLIAMASLLVVVILNMLTHIMEVNKVVKNIEKAETFIDLIEVYDDYSNYLTKEKKVKDEFSKVSLKYFEKNTNDLSALFLPYNILEEDTHINSDYKGIILYIKDFQNIYIFPNKLMWQLKNEESGNKTLVFNNTYYNFEKNIVNLENIPNADSYKFSFDYAVVKEGRSYSGEGYEKLDTICYYLNSNDGEKIISLELDQYNNISIYDSKRNLFAQEGYTTRHHYVNTIKMLNFNEKIKTEINISTPEISVKDSAILFTYNIGNNKELADAFFKEYQNYLDEYYRISTKNNMVYVYAQDDIVACIKCGHEDLGYFMMVSFNYSDKIEYTSSNSKSTNKSNSYKTSKGCGYKYSNGSTCGASVGSHSPLCDYHFYQLDSTYKYYTGY